MTDTLASSVEEALIWAYDIDADGGVTPLHWAQLAGAPPPGCWRWIHLNRMAPETARWLNEDSGLDDVLVEALLQEETRPRCLPMAEGVLANFRGVNLNKGAEPDDMVAVRMWLEGNRVITLRRFVVFALRDVRDNLLAGRGPSGPGELLADFASALIGKIADTIEQMEDRLDEMEIAGMTGEDADQRAELVNLRRTVIPLRRYLAPQRAAFVQILGLDVPWLKEHDRASLRETADRLTRSVEDLEAVREGAGLLHEEISNRLAERMNVHTHLLSVVAVIFLPLGFLTGLLGINVAGIPGTDWGWAFTIVCALALVIAVLEYLVFKRLDWL